jgi:hypothetical protein
LHRGINKKGGYVGLLFLLVSLAVMSFLFWYIYLKPATRVIDNSTQNNTTLFEQNRQAIDSANRVKALIEQQSASSTAN